MVRLIEKNRWKFVALALWLVPVMGVVSAPLVAQAAELSSESAGDVDGGQNGGEIDNNTLIDPSDPSCIISQERYQQILVERAVILEQQQNSGGEGNGAGGGDPSGDCLRSDSIVTLVNGKTKTVAEVKLGDQLQGPDGPATVTMLNRAAGEAMLYYRINDFKFAITGDHPIQTTKGWKAADDTMKSPDIVVGRLDPGDVVITKNGPVEVKTVTLEKPKKDVSAINFRTRDDRAFYVDGVAIKPFKDITFTY